MKNMMDRLKSISMVQILAVLLIILGLAIMIPKGRGMFEFYKEARFARENNFQAGNVSPDLLRPWMSIRYISVAYAVPQKYLFDASGIRPGLETSMVSLSRLNNQLHLGQVNGSPALIGTVRQAILAYRASPIATGLIEHYVSDWMTVQYIANSTGLSADAIFQQINVPAEGNANKPITYLSETIGYQGGPKALVAAIQKVVDTQSTPAAQPTEPAKP